jgi:hypothetical protein
MPRKHPFSEQLRRAVEGGDKTRYRISKETDIDQSTLSRFVNHGAGLSMESVDRLCKCLGLRLVMEGKARRKKGGK